MNIGQELIEWYHKNKRDLPWRKTQDPYKIWISEIVLQQTRVEQGMNYYLRFIERFPDVKTLACASEDEVLKYWQGLGYYSRARNLHFSAKYIVKELDGKFPECYLDLKKLKGVGDYTAAAIASFAYNENVPLVDGNVFRFLSRLYAEKTPIDSSQGKNLFFQLAKELLKPYEAIVYNQAIMEFGALQCKPAKPDCTECPLNSKCLAFAKNQVTNYPVKSKKTKVRKRYLNYLYVSLNNSIFLKKRVGSDIWKGLYELPLIETKSKVSLKTISKTKEWGDIFESLELNIIGKPHEVLHQLSHQQLHVTFNKISIDEKLNESGFFSDYEKVLISDIDKYPVPKVIENYLEINLR